MDPTNTTLYNTSDVSHNSIKVLPEEVLEICDECRENRICKTIFHFPQPNKLTLLNSRKYFGPSQN